MPEPFSPYERVTGEHVEAAWERLQTVAQEHNVCPHTLLEQVGYLVTNPQRVAMVKVSKRNDGKVRMDMGRTLRTMVVSRDQAHEIGQALCTTAKLP